MARNAALRKGFCNDCEDIKHIRGRGLCDTCWKRRRRRGTVYELPRRPVVIERYKEFLTIKQLNPELTADQIAERIGVTERTIDRYNGHRLRRQVIQCLEAVGL